MKNKIVIFLTLLAASGISYAELGEDIYSGSSCVSCHGQTATGISGKGQKLKGMPATKILAFIEKAKSDKGIHKESMEPSDSCDVGMSDKEAEIMAQWLAAEK
ncbi:MAG: c-type cytochrome [Gammaproteobacteria bacterium]|jgi:cytochrome c553|nr:c-type cytochrome [Gammaproteobacteria bacterium]